MVKKTLKYGLLVGLIAAAVSAHASIIFETPPGSTAGGQPVDARATFSFGTNSLQIVLQNLEANPTSVIQAISDLEFTLSLGASSGSLSSSSGQEITIASGGTYTLGSTVSTGWGLTANGAGSFTLDVLGTATAPAHLIIGPPDGSNVYSNANGSIAGNGPHNPFLDLSATFNLSIPGVTAGTTITGVNFSFGTTEGTTVPGTQLLAESVPEPATLGLIGLGLAALGFSRKRSH